MRTILSVGDGLLHDQVNVDVVALESLEVREQPSLHLLRIEELEFPISF
ncbi:MAG: hypothetical protein ACMG6E_04550 [Candidatus Roizmanbacteria bacterium]